MKKLNVTREIFPDSSLGSLCAGLKSSKKPYVAYSDRSIVNRAVIRVVSIDEEHLEKLDKASKPQWWFQLQSVKDRMNDKDLQLEGLDVFQFGFMDNSGIESGVPDKLLAELSSKYNVNTDEFRLVKQPNGYCTLTKRF